MGNLIAVNSLEELAKFLNDKGVLEIAMRGKNKKFAEFQKIALNNAPQEEAKEMMKQAINLMNKNNALAENSLSMINNVAKLQQLSLILNGFSLCATCVGFAIMYAKLDKVSGQINQLMNVVSQEHDIQADYEFKKVISEHANMLDCRKTQKYYKEEQMRKLVDDEYNVLGMLIDVFMKDLSSDPENLIFSIYSLASMLAVSLRYFDELYYFNNKETIGNGEVWHSSHDNWTLVFDRLVSPEFMMNIQDHGMFDLNLSTIENDIYHISLFDLIKSLIEDVKDNQTLIKTLDSQESLAQVSNCINSEVVIGVQNAFSEIEGALEQEEVVKAYQDAMKQMALAV